MNDMKLLAAGDFPNKAAAGSQMILQRLKRLADTKNWLRSQLRQIDETLEEGTSTPEYIRMLRRDQRNFAMVLRMLADDADKVANENR